MVTPLVIPAKAGIQCGAQRHPSAHPEPVEESPFALSLSKGAPERGTSLPANQQRNAESGRTDQSNPIAKREP